MSSSPNPLEQLHQMALKLKGDLAQQREWISFMRDAGVDMSQHEIALKNNQVKYENWANALRNKGFTDV